MNTSGTYVVLLWKMLAKVREAIMLFVISPDFLRVQIVPFYTAHLWTSKQFCFHKHQMQFGTIIIQFNKPYFKYNMDLETLHCEANSDEIVLLIISKGAKVHFYKGLIILFTLDNLNKKKSLVKPTSFLPFAEYIPLWVFKVNT